MSEDDAVNTLKKLAKRWPKTLWLFANGQSLNVMRTKNGQRMMTRVGGGVDPAYCVASVNIPNDGGDW